MTRINRVPESEKNTLLSETTRAAWADLTRTQPRDRTADDLSPEQKAAFAKAWSVEGDGIYNYDAYDTPKGGSKDNALSPGYWFNKDPNHQVEKLFGRGTASWTKDGDLVFNDTYDLDFGGKNLPGIPTNADPDKFKIKSRISARDLGLDPKKLWETANARIQAQWAKLEPTMDKVYKDVQAGSYTGQADGAIREVQTLQARYNRINSGPYKPETASTLATWKPPEARNLEEFDAYMDKMPATGISTRQAAKGGDSSGPSRSSGVPSGHNPALDGHGGPRIVVNPSTFENEKDAACVAWNEAFRIVMEEMQFDPVSEPTDEQREFFSDTAYADDELMLRRTILARICVFDTSVKDPTDEQLQEAVEFLQNVLEAGYPQNEGEQRNVKRILDVLSAVPMSNGRPEPAEPAQPMEHARPAEHGARAAELGGETEEDDRRTLGEDIKPVDPTTDAKGPAAQIEPAPEVDRSVESVTGTDLRPVDPTRDASGPLVPKEDEK